MAALLVDGLTSKEAARNLGISPRTVDIHRASLLRKYAVNSTPELIRRIVN
ncbi:Bacterial regulatory protein, luxR family [compost metagenome]